MKMDMIVHKGNHVCEHSSVCLILSEQHFCFDDGEGQERAFVIAICRAQICLAVVIWAIFVEERAATKRCVQARFLARFRERAVQFTRDVDVILNFMDGQDGAHARRQNVF